MFGIDRDELTRLGRPVTRPPPAIRDSLLASATTRPAWSAASGGPQPLGAGDRVQNDVGRPSGQIARSVRPGHDVGKRSVLRPTVADPLAQLVDRRLAGHTDHFDTESDRLGGQLRDVRASRGDGGDPESVSGGPGHVDGLGSDRPGRAEQHDRSPIAHDAIVAEPVTIGGNLGARITRVQQVADRSVPWPTCPTLIPTTRARPRTTPPTTRRNTRRTGAGTRDFGPIARVAGWVCVVILLLMITTTHYNGAGTFALVATAVLLVLGLLADIHRRKTAWRN